MTQGYEALTEKEKQTLRLMLQGHDAKSLARYLGLSVHTINERLRDARRKLSVTSSREAARLVRDIESTIPEKLADVGFGEAGTAVFVGAPDFGAVATGRGVRFVGGFTIMSLSLALLALASSGDLRFGDKASDTARSTWISALADTEADAPVRCVILSSGKSSEQADDSARDITASRSARDPDQAAAYRVMQNSDKPIRLRCDALSPGARSIE